MGPRGHDNLRFMAKLLYMILFVSIFSIFQIGYPPMQIGVDTEGIMFEVEGGGEHV